MQVLRSGEKNIHIQKPKNTITKARAKRVIVKNAGGVGELDVVDVSDVVGCACHVWFASNADNSVVTKLNVVVVIAVLAAGGTPFQIQQHLYWPNTGGSSKASPPTVVSKHVP